MHIVHHDKKTARLFLESAGFWDLAEAMAFHTEVAAACRDSARAGARLSILSDLTDYMPQGGPVADTHARTVDRLLRTPLARYALVAPTALNRMRLRRMLAGIEFQIFPDMASAVAWMGWDTAYAARLPRLVLPTPPAAAPAPMQATPTYGRAA